jgi:ADP-heptose:LPS heptosyltransferase
MRILSLNYETALGSAVHATPVFAAIRKQKPGWEIHVACSGISADLLSSNPHIDKLWITPHVLQNTIESYLWFIRNRMNMGKFDMILFNSGNSRTKVNIASRLIRGKSRNGFSVRPFLVNSHLQYNDDISLIENNLMILDLLDLPASTDAYPEIWISKSEAAQAMKWCKSITGNNSAPVIGFFAGTSGGHPNQWYDDRFISVANEVTRTLGANSVFFGGPKDAAHAELLASQCLKNAISVAGKTTVTQLAAYTAVCDLILTVDTGGMHVAWAAGTPVVVLGHAANPRHIWHPHDYPLMKIIRKDEKVSCALCRKHYCSTRECMSEISTQEVISTVLNQLENFSASETGRLARINKWTAQKN